MRSLSWLTDSRREMAVELHRELLERGASNVRRRLKGGAPVAAPSPLDADAWDEQTPVDDSHEELTEPEALWRALAELDLEAEAIEPAPMPTPRATPPPNYWPSTEWGMPVHERVTRPDNAAAEARAARRRLAHGTADPTLEAEPAFTDRRVTYAEYVVLARRDLSRLPAKATSRPIVMSGWEMPAQRSVRWSVLKLVTLWVIGLTLVSAVLIAAGMALP